MLMALHSFYFPSSAHCLGREGFFLMVEIYTWDLHIIEDYFGGKKNMQGITIHDYLSHPTNFAFREFISKKEHFHSIMTNG
jgi:hypothetical protein